LKVSEFLGTLLTKELENKFLATIKEEYKLTDVSKLENISNMNVHELCNAFDKSNAPDKKLGLPTLDKDYKGPKFFD